MKINPKKYYTIYQLTNLVNGKIYIGFHSTNDLDDGYLGSGKLIKRAVEKYNPENFIKEYLAIFDNKEEAEQLEAELVNKEFTQRDDTYNLSEGGNILILSGKNHYVYGKTWDEAIGKEKADELRKKTSKRFKGKKLTEEHKEKILFAVNERWTDDDYKEKMSQLHTGRKHSKETKLKMSESHKGKKLTEEHRAVISAKQKKRYAEMTIEEKEKLYSSERNQKISEKLKGRDTSSWQDKINKNPEKIRKTAEKHRGMKRSEESKQKMRNAHAGKKCFFHPDFEKRRKFVPGNEPEGWKRVKPE